MPVCSIVADHKSEERYTKLSLSLYNGRRAPNDRKSDCRVYPGVFFRSQYLRWFRHRGKKDDYDRVLMIVTVRGEKCMKRLSKIGNQECH
jgi:hypothetical protein